VLCDRCIRKYYATLGKPMKFAWGLAIGVTVALVGLMLLGAIGVCVMQG
jgi:uncharacterized YccA/Bax inhibitor family protein